MQKEQYVPTGKGLIALSPLMVFLMMYVGLSIFVGDFYTVPLSVAFVLSSVWGVATTARLPLSERLKVFSRGAANIYGMDIYPCRSVCHAGTKGWCHRGNG